jgi:hypothetical protein
MNPIGGTARIRNATGAPYAVEECPGVTIQPGETVDLLDDTLPSHYAIFSDVERLLTKAEGAKLRQDVVAGNIEIVELVPGVPV